MISSIQPASQGQQSHSVSDDEWASRTNEVASAAADRTMEQYKDAGAGVAASNDTYFSHFQRMLNERQPESDAHANTLINKVTVNIYAKLRERNLNHGLSEEEAASAADTVSKTFEARCHQTLFAKRPVEQDAMEKDHPSARGVFSRPNSSQPASLKKPKFQWLRRSKKSKPSSKRGRTAASEKRPVTDEEANVFGIRDNIREATRTPSKETAVWGVVSVGIGGILALPFAIWTSKDLCHASSPHHDAQGCNYAITAAVAAGMIVFGGLLAGAAICCSDSSRRKIYSLYQSRSTSKPA